MADPIHIDRFVFPSETSTLSDEEWKISVRCLDWAAALIEERRRRAAREGAAFAVYLPAGNWDWSTRHTFELDSAVTNQSTSFELLMTRDREVIRQLRLYSQAFSGYQLATLASGDIRGWIRKRLPANLDEFLALLVHLPDPIFERWAVLARALPQELRVPPPWKFGEMGWLVGDYIVNHDSWAYLQRIALLHEAGILQRLSDIAKSRRPRILEIGGGYGALGHLVTTLIPQVRYAVIDLPESLAFSATYLAVVKHPSRVNLPVAAGDIDAQSDFCMSPNFLLPDVVKRFGPFDLVINTNSLHEMTEAQVHSYCSVVAGAMASGGQFFEQNADGMANGVPSGLPGLIARHFPKRTPCPSTLVGPGFVSGPARIWSMA